MAEFSIIPNDTAPWSGLAYRFTVFFKDLESVPDGDRAFAGFFGTPHTEKVEKPTELLESFRAQGPGCLQQVIRTPRKLDFTITAPSNLQLEDHKIKAFTHGYCDDELTRFRPSIESFVRSHAQHACRLAIGADLGIDVPNRESGYELLGRKLRTLRPDPNISSELLYQINYPRIVELEGHSVRINRLSNWSCSRGLINMVVNEDELVVDFFQARVRLDINSDPSFDTSILSADSQINLSNTFFAYVIEIGEKGEIP